MLHLAGTRGSDVNSYTILQDGDGIGSVAFIADGNSLKAAEIKQLLMVRHNATPGTYLTIYLQTDAASVTLKYDV